MGLSFGIGLFVMMDELAKSGARLHAGPAGVPVAGARAWGSGHLKFGLVSEIVLEGLNPVA